MPTNDEPQITAIASYFARRIPANGVQHEDAVQAWRHTLRHARSNGQIDELAEMLAEEAPDDRMLQATCKEVAR